MEISHDKKARVLLEILRERRKNAEAGNTVDFDVAMAALELRIQKRQEGAPDR